MTNDTLTTPQLRLKIRGRPERFGGRHAISGFKHSLALVAAACTVAEGTLRIANVPRIAETRLLATLLRAHGARVEPGDGTLEVNASSLRPAVGVEDVERRIHGSVYLLPGILRKVGAATLAAGGGCALGSGPGGIRPFEHYAGVLRDFGVVVHTRPDGTIDAHGCQWPGADLDMSRYLSSGLSAAENHYSGATKMAVLMAAGAGSPSTIRNPYAKLEMSTLLETLRSAGVDTVSRWDSRQHVLIVDPGGGAKFVAGAAVRLPADLIEVVTFVVAAAVFGTDDLYLTNLLAADLSDGLDHELAAFRRFGVDLELGDDHLRIRPAQARLTGAELTSCHAPSPYSDSQPFFALLGAFARGLSRITDEVWPARFGYVDEMRKLGMAMTRTNAGVTVHGGVRGPKAAVVQASDLRSAAVLTLACTALDGETVVAGVQHLRRGYPDLAGALRALGADIESETP